MTERDDNAWVNQERSYGPPVGQSRRNFDMPIALLSESEISNVDEACRRIVGSMKGVHDEIVGILRLKKKNEKYIRSFDHAEMLADSLIEASSDGSNLNILHITYDENRGFLDISSTNYADRTVQTIGIGEAGFFTSQTRYYSENETFPLGKHAKPIRAVRVGILPGHMNRLVGLPGLNRARPLEILTQTSQLRQTLNQYVRANR